MKILKNLIYGLFFFAFSVVNAQVTTSSIKGMVADESGASFSGANIIAVHTPSGTKSGAITNFDGRYNLLNLRVGGPYSITVSYVGYSTLSFDNVYLDLGKAFNLDVTLTEDSQQLDAVVLTTGGAKNTFGSDRTGAETNIGRRELTRLPTISRSASDFTRLEPSSSNGSFGGRNDQFNNYSLDGAIFNNPFGLDAATPGGQTDAQPVSLDALEQIQVSTAPYDVRQSGFTGALINAVTKSGTNNFHGTVYGFYRNESLTGSEVKGDEVSVADLKQLQFGASLGGAIVKNKLFFFANFEKDDREDLGQNWLPNNGSGLINESRVLESDLIEVRDALLAVGYDPGAYEGFTNKTESTKGIFKLDWNINDNNRLALIYNFLDASKEKPAHPTALGFRGPSASTLQFENAGYQINNKLQSFQMELNSDFEGNASNKFQVGYTHFNDFRNPKSTPAPSLTITKDGSNYIIAGHEPFSINNDLQQKVFQFSDNISFVKGKHTTTVGISFEKFQFDNSFNLGVYGAQGVFFPTTTMEGFGEFASSGALQAAFDAAIAAENAAMLAAVAVVQADVDGNETDGDAADAALGVRIDSVESEIDTARTNLYTALGQAEAAQNMGTFTGSTLSDNTTVRALLQELETDTESRLSQLGGQLTGDLTLRKSDGSAVALVLSRQDHADMSCAWKVTPSYVSATKEVLSVLANGQVVAHFDERQRFAINMNDPDYTLDVGGDGHFSTNLVVDGTLTLGSVALTATGTELNYTDGVTSNIQTQLNAIQADVDGNESDADTALATKAPLSSPALTGTPTAPTAGAGTNTTQIATTAFVETAVSNLVDGAPGALNTLNELAAALNDDTSAATNLTTLINANETHIDNIVTLSGVAKDANDFGSFTGSTIADNQNVKQALQALETSVETKLAAETITLTAFQAVVAASSDFADFKSRVAAL